jgi:beta-lactamase class A
MIGALLLVIAISASGAELGKKLGAIAAKHRGKVSVYAKNLATGDSVTIDPQKPVATASVIKLPLMLQAFEQVKAGKIKLSDPVELTKTPESDTRQDTPEPGTRARRR